MFLALLVSSYILCSLLIGVAFHMLSIVDFVAEPGKRELFVFFAVFAVAGVPILLVTLAVVAFSFLSGSQETDASDPSRIDSLGQSSSV
jgi:hypothetical protein